MKAPLLYECFQLFRQLIDCPERHIAEESLEKSHLFPNDGREMEHNYQLCMTLAARLRRIELNLASVSNIVFAMRVMAKRMKERRLR